MFRTALRQAISAPWLRDPLWARARMVPAFDIDANWGPTPVDRVSGLNLTTSTRTASATFVDSDGSIQTAGTNVLRRQWDATNRRWGWLVEEARTNSIRNNTMVGAAAGTPGTLPTNWPAGSQAGLSRQIVAVGTANGVNYIDIRYFGTTSSTFGSYFVEANNQIAASNGQTWTASAWLGLVAGSTSGITSINLGVRYNDAASALLTQVVTNVLPSIGTFQRFSLAGTAANASTAFANIALTLGLTNGAAVDFTLRIGLPQLELGAFATSAILTNNSGAATRDADMWNWLSIPSVRSLYAEFTSPASGARGVASLNDNSSSQRIALNTSGTDPLLTVVDGGVTQANIDAGTITANTVNRMAARFGTNDFAASINGGAEGVDTAGTLPVVDRMFIGRSQAGEYLNGSISRLTGFARPLPVTQEMAR